MEILSYVLLGLALTVVLLVIVIAIWPDRAEAILDRIERRLDRLKLRLSKKRGSGL